MRKSFLILLYGLFLFATTPVAADDYPMDEDDIVTYILTQTSGKKEVYIERNAVRQFIDDKSYDDPSKTRNYSYSIVKNYSKGVPSTPMGILLDWDSSTPTNLIREVVVTLVEEGDLHGEKRQQKKVVRHYYPDINNTEYFLSNMCPNKSYSYTIEEVLQDGRKKVQGRGEFFTTGQVRMLAVGGMANVRDFGGWKTSFGTEIVYGRLYRGNRPDVITAAGKNDFVKNERITADLDLRGKDLGSSPFGPEVRYYCTNNRRYKSALTSQTSILVRDLDIIADELSRGGNLFLHCNHGANRAGTLSFLIGGILGMSEVNLSKDYELSAFAYSFISRSKTYGEMLPVIRSHGEPGDDLAQCFYNYARHIGTSEKTLDTIRCIMLGLSPNDPRILKAHKN